jgi:hypothetical protein
MSLVRSNEFAFNAPSVTAILPTEPGDAVVVPNTNLSSDSSQIIAALSPVLPLSIIIPESFTFVDAPQFKPIILSDTSMLV